MTRRDGNEKVELVRLNGNYFLNNTDGKNYTFSGKDTADEELTKLTQGKQPVINITESQLNQNFACNSKESYRAGQADAVSNIKQVGREQLQSQIENGRA